MTVTVNVELWCIGCGAQIWSGPIGAAGLAITCLCGGNALRDAAGHIAWPSSFYFGEPGHIEHVLGWSEYTDPVKESAEKLLIARGYFHSWDCKDAECQEHLRKSREDIGFYLQHRPDDIHIWTPLTLRARLQFRTEELRQWLEKWGIHPPATWDVHLGVFA